MSTAPILLVGEICIDFTISKLGLPPKLRLGGIVHAARGLWAANIQYSVAAICPSYLLEQAKTYLEQFGCTEFIHYATVEGAPNLIIIGDVQEVGDQGYEDILRDARFVNEEESLGKIRAFEHVVLFPGRFSLQRLQEQLQVDAKITIDAAYDVSSADDLSVFKGKIENFVISTSSPLFEALGSKDVRPLLEFAAALGAQTVLLKENRGGSRLFDLRSNSCELIPATIGQTANSVGVGDAYTSVFAAFKRSQPAEAAWRGAQVATNYAMTTFPDDFKAGVQRDFKLSQDEIRALSGVSLPWHQRKKSQIYLAAPDFSYLEKPEVDKAVSVLEYHNFCVRRPVFENGEANPDALPHELHDFYLKDVALLSECHLVFAIPLGRDPGTLVEIGMALALNKPVVVFDPRRENNNTMVICASQTYSDDLDICLNAVFEAIAKMGQTQ